jgi:hypothetical protein
MHAKRWKRKGNAARGDADPTVWPPAINHGSVYEFEPELLKPIPRQVVERSEVTAVEKRKGRLILTVLLTFWIFATYALLLPKNTPVTSVRDLVTLPD